MTVDLLVLVLVRMQLAVSPAILVVALMRPLARRLLGPELAYPLWALVPVAAFTSLFPTLDDFLHGPVHWSTLHPVVILGSERILILFAAGAAATLSLFLIGEWRFRWLASAGRAGPAVIGFSWPRLVVPADFEARFTADERRLIREHERTHIRGDHPGHNRLIAAAQVLGWFNPLVHLAAGWARLDQELACDAVVIERMPRFRRLYAETLLKAHGAGPWSVFACALAGGSRHPLEVRIGLLRRTPLNIRQYLLGVALLGGLAVIMAAVVFTLAPHNYIP